MQGTCEAPRCVSLRLATTHPVARVACGLESLPLTNAPTCRSASPAENRPTVKAETAQKVAAVRLRSTPKASGWRRLLDVAEEVWDLSAAARRLEVEAP